MKCPLCAVDLVMADRQGIEIDYCPKCRGIWLDRGEIDKIIERSQAVDAGRAAPPPAPQPAPQYRAPPQPQAPGWAQPAAGWAQPPGHWKRDDDDDDDGRRRHGYPKKRKGFLSEILDFD